MKRMLPLFVLASCAPTAMQTATYTDTRTYRCTCAAAFAAVVRMAPSLRPASNTSYLQAIQLP